MKDKYRETLSRALPFINNPKVVEHVTGFLMGDAFDEEEYLNVLKESDNGVSKCACWLISEIVRTKPDTIAIGFFHRALEQRINEYQPH